MTGSDNTTRHYVDPAPFDPHVAEALTPEQERFYQASQWRIMWWKFRRHRVAVISAIVLFILYLTVPFAEVIAPYTPNQRDNDHLYAPPQMVHLFDNGTFVGPFVYGTKASVNLELLKWDYEVDKTDVQPLRFFCSGSPYMFWGLFEARFHLFCPAEGLSLIHI